MTDRPVVYVTQAIHPDALALLREQAEVHVGFGVAAESLDGVLDRVEGLLLRHDGVAAEVIRDAPRLRAVSRAGAGFENVPVEAARVRGIPVLVPSDANSRTVAEHVFALTLAALRRIPAWERRTRAGEPGLALAREGELSHDLSGRTLGVIGMGRIGREVARIARHGFLMEVLAFHPRRTDDEVRALGAEPVGSLDDLLRRSHVVTVQVPYSEQTKGMLGAAQFARMREDAVLVNVSRGGVVDEEALAKAIAEGRIAGAGVDVWEGKVPRPDNPLLALDQVVATPHRAGRTEEAQRRSGLLAAQGLLDVLRGLAPTGTVDVTH
ncbi:hydroxyacid dehydrogenase [Nonomuraea sp. M3C6]|uniref:Hydroxyacid dehydrogenase n=1 Tax=Nonomuraea marmarensis TaxID=3351344 RepID=A0ABW7AI05_9ACTN